MADKRILVQKIPREKAKSVLATSERPHQAYLASRQGAANAFPKDMIADEPPNALTFDFRAFLYDAEGLWILIRAISKRHPSSRAFLWRGNRFLQFGCWRWRRNHRIDPAYFRPFIGSSEGTVVESGISSVLHQGAEAILKTSCVLEC
jgi:hypothetical protein